jgi:hypothetical protein
MIVLVGPLLLVLLAVAAVALKKRGLAGGAVALFVVVGLVCIGAVMFAILAWGFSGFG